MLAAPSRFPMRFEAWYRALSSALFLPPGDCTIDVDGDTVSVKMGWAFQARFPRSAVVGTRLFQRRPLSRGVHGFAGCWLVNGSGDRIVVIDLQPQQRARVLGVSVRLSELKVSVDDPDGLRARLSAREERGVTHS